MHLGDFGAVGALKPDPKKEAEPDTATFGGSPIRLKDPEDIPGFYMMEFARLMVLGLPQKGMHTMSTCYGVIEASVHDDDFGMIRSGAPNVDDQALINFVLALYDRWADVPLALSPPSSDGATPDQEKPSASSNRRSRRGKRKEETPEEIQRRIESVVLPGGSAE